MALAWRWRGGCEPDVPAKSQFHHNSVSGISYWDYLIAL